jgi:DNA helicase-2/ATP-dependent DNA helicase PcrA
MSNSNRIWAEQQTNIFGWMESGSGNAAVVARAGTGKTTVIEHGVKNAPETKSVYCVFNKKNQLEAERRIKKTGLDIKTLHGLGFAFVRNSWKGVRPDDSSRREDIEMDRIMAVDSRMPATVAYAIKRTIGFAKNTILGVPSVTQLVELMIDKGFEPEFATEEEQATWTTEKLAAYAKQAMEAALTRNHEGRISFDDMVWLPTAANMVRPWYSLVIVDEAQDMSMPQLEMAIRACKSTGRILIVGDPRQCIYGFRGAATNGMQVMIERLQAKVFPLTTTYRCAKSIVSLAATLVQD